LVCLQSDTIRAVGTIASDSLIGLLGVVSSLFTIDSANVPD
jgi:hypothetical protein